MKVSEIILEATPSNIPNFGTAGQSYNVNYNLGGNATTPKSTKATAKKSVPAKASPKIDLKTRPFDLLNQAMPEKAPKVKGVAAKAIKSLAAKSVYKVLKGTALISPLLIWVDDMSAINVMFESGYFNSYGNKAGEVAQQMRTAHTQMLFSRYATILPAWWLGVKASSMAIRLAMGLIPGIGWLATLGSLAAGLAVTAMLQTDLVQKYIVLYIIENIPGLDDAVYETAKFVAGTKVASGMPQFFNKIKDKFVKNAADATPQPVKDVGNTIGAGANAVGSAAKTIANKVAPSAPLGNISDLAKELD
jgi:hypothetical protein